MNENFRLFFTQVLVSLVVVGTGAVGVCAQVVFQTDVAFGKNGVVAEDLPEAWKKMAISSWTVNADGSVYIARVAPLNDTTGLISKSQRNGMPDPFFSSDGITHIPSAFLSSVKVSYRNALPVITSLRAARMEIHSVSQSGAVPLQPTWQDNDKFVNAKIIGFNSDADLVMWSVSNSTSTPTWILRYVRGLGSNQVSVDEVPVSTTPYNFSEGTSTLDKNDRILSSFTMADSKLLIARYLANGTLDESFGNALGILVVNLGMGDVARNVKILHTANGGYLVSMTVSSPAPNSTKTTTIHLLRLTQNGGIDPTFGDRGLVVLSGSLMDSYGALELPNGSFFATSFGTIAGYSHLYQLSTDGKIFPGTYGDFSIFSVGSLGEVPIFQGKYLYGSVNNGSGGRAIMRYKMDNPPLSVDDINQSNKIHIENQAGQVFARGSAEPTHFYVHSLLGELVWTTTLPPYHHGRVSIPDGIISGASFISAHNNNTLATSILIQ